MAASLTPAQTCASKRVDRPGMSILLPAWPEIPGIVALTTTRRGGASVTPYAGFNLASGVGDKERNVMANRDNLNTGLGLGRDPCWLKQLHATTVVDVPTTVGAPADGAVTSQAGVVCAILTARLCTDTARAARR